MADITAVISYWRSYTDIKTDKRVDVHGIHALARYMQMYGLFLTSSIINRVYHLNSTQSASLW